MRLSFIGNPKDGIASETDNLHIPDSNPEAKGIYEISIEIDIVSKRAVNTGVGKIVILDGLRKYKILYIENNEVSSASILYLEAPYNTFIELPQNAGSVSEMNIHIINSLKPSAYLIAAEGFNLSTKIGCFEYL